MKYLKYIVILLIIIFIFLKLKNKENFNNYRSILFFDKLLNTIFKNNRLETDKTIIHNNKLMFNDYFLDKNGISTKNNGTYTINASDVMVDGEIHAKGKICIGGVCFDKNHILAMRGEKTVWLQSMKDKAYLGNFDPEHSHGQNTARKGRKRHHHSIHNTRFNAVQFGGKGNWEKMRLDT